MCRSIAAITLATLLASQGVCHAVVVASLETNVAPAGTAGDPYNPTFTAGGPSTTDLLEGLLPTVAIGNLTQENSLGASALTNGTVATAYGSGDANSAHIAYATGGPGEEVTYALGGIYDLDSIVIFGGWNDAGRDAQSYDLYVSSDGAQNFSLLTNYNNGNGEEQGVVTTPVSHRVEFTEDSLPNLATGVTHVKVDFLDVENGYTGYTEIDVFGSLVNVPGDADGDGDVDLDDFFVISNHFFTTPSAIGLDGDVEPDNIVDEKDFRLWKSVASASVLAEFAALGVPEPSTLALIGVSMGLLAGRRRG
ncbi:hypothetical protein Pla123a_30360 [Posidoniimonas polymericola]|uniref:Ice-binding protein C-terminal domain-containing protein n=1 Tax=Posidoniimonas polymericola TaxID=2528002 RepID=A0A5C5YKX2_9BACT|nr:PEP-CTERM sorting domain-containing protein [Posidoniimonas polymericola]TWT75526.1 hypothetical protein Pla123a_30360 [Posidoniimonas polymericola]